MKFYSLVALGMLGAMVLPSVVIAWSPPLHLVLSIAVYLLWLPAIYLWPSNNMVIGLAIGPLLVMACQLLNLVGSAIGIEDLVSLSVVFIASLLAAAYPMTLCCNQSKQWHNT